MLKKVCLISMLFILSSVCFATYTLPETITCNFKTHMCNLPQNSYHLHAQGFMQGIGTETLNFVSIVAKAKPPTLANSLTQVLLFHFARAIYMNKSEAEVIITAGPNVFANSTFAKPSYQWRRYSLHQLMNCSVSSPTECPLIQRQTQQG